MPENPDQPCIVVDKYGPLELGAYPDTPRAGVLLRGDIATVFRNRRQARRATDRTARYAAKQGYDWQTWSHQVINLRPAGE